MEQKTPFSWLSVWPIVVALIINSVGWSIVSTQLKTLANSKQPATSSLLTDKEILEKLVAIQEKVSRLETASEKTNEPILGTATNYNGMLSDLLVNASPIPASTAGTTTTTQSTKGYVTIASAAKGQLEVHKEMLRESPVIDWIFYGQKYPFSTKLNNWYLLTLPTGKIGWVEAQYLKETL